MRIGVLGTGVVGTTIANKLVQLGHEVKMGSRTADKPAAWAQSAGANASGGTFAEAAAFAEVAFNCTNGSATLHAMELAGAENLRGKILIELANPLDFSKGFPPALFVGNDDSLAERVQRALPETKVIKALNTVNCSLMVDPQRLAGGDHDLFLCGNDAGAKSVATELLQTWFGWKSVIDLGDLSNARATEAYVTLWVRLYGTLKTPNFNVKVVR